MIVQPTPIGTDKHWDNLHIRKNTVLNSKNMYMISSVNNALTPYARPLSFY